MRFDPRALAGDPAILGQATNRLFELFERTDLDLANPLATDVVNVAQLLKRLGFVDQATFKENVALPLVERIECLGQKLATNTIFLILRKKLILQGRVVGEHVLPLSIVSFSFCGTSIEPVNTFSPLRERI